jgi:hypothetical protein
MMPRPVAALLVMLLAAGCTSPAASRGSPGTTAAGASDRQILVMVADPEIGRLDLRGARSGPYRFDRNYLGRSPQVARVLRDLVDEYRLREVEGWPMLSLGVHCAVFTIERGATVDSVIARLAADARVESAQPMQRFELRVRRENARTNDPYRPLQRSLEDLGLANAHRWAIGRGVRVAVVDTGVDARHPELGGQVTERKSFIEDDVLAAGDRHGTAVAGIIASLAGNSRGIVGVSPGAKLLALKACVQREADGNGACTSFSLARAIDHAIVAGSDVLNLSLGGPSDRLLERLLAKAMERDVIVVAALGHAGRRDGFPASMKDVIVVGDEDSPPDARWLRAPGVDVLTLVPSDGYDYLSGSSLAAAHVSGIVALLLENSPTLRGAEIERLLARTSRGNPGAGKPQRTMVSACAALAEIADEPVCGTDVELARAAVWGRRQPRLESD